MVGSAAVEEVERYAPPPLHARSAVIADRHRIEVEHLDILRDAALGGQVHLDVVDQQPEEEVIGIDRTDQSAGHLLHRIGIEQVVARPDDRIDVRGVDLGAVGAALGTAHVPRRVLVDGGMPDELHGCLLHRHDGSLRHAVGTGPDDGDLGRRHGLLHDLRLLHDLHRNNLLHGDDLR